MSVEMPVAVDDHPVAKQTDEVMHETPCSTFWYATLGLGMTFHVPSISCSMSVKLPWEQHEKPAATQEEEAAHETP
jgi:hypothetical protein